MFRPHVDKVHTLTDGQAGLIVLQSATDSAKAGSASGDSMPRDLSTVMFVQSFCRVSKVTRRESAVNSHVGKPGLYL